MDEVLGHIENNNLSALRAIYLNIQLGKYNHLKFNERQRMRKAILDHIDR